MATMTIWHGKAKPIKAVGKNQCRLLSFLEKYPGWHSVRTDRATMRAANGLLKREAIAYRPETNQACLIYYQNR